MWPAGSANKRLSLNWMALDTLPCVSGLVACSCARVGAPLPSCSGIKRRWPSMWGSNFLSSFFSPSPLFSPSFKASPTSWWVNKVGALGSRYCSCLNCLPSCLWLVAESPHHPPLPVRGQAGGWATLRWGGVGGTFPIASRFPLHPHHPLGFSIPLPHLSSWALALLGCLPERSMKQAMTVSIMGVNEANFRAPERLTSSLSLMLGPQVGGEALGFSEFHSWVKVWFLSSPPSPCPL